MTRPLIISDCDEVLLHMVVPFRAWLDATHGIHFSFTCGFEEALRHKDSGDPVERARVWALLTEFFETRMHLQTPIAGAQAAMARLATRADIVIVTNIGAELADARAAQLREHALPWPVIGNRGGKGPVVAELLAARQAPIAFFIDDLGSNHASVAKAAPGVWRLQMVGEPELAPHIAATPQAHARIDRWATATAWIEARLDEYEAVVGTGASGQAPA